MVLPSEEPMVLITEAVGMAHIVALVILVMASAHTFTSCHNLYSFLEVR
jgi:hypothetical protein